MVLDVCQSLPVNSGVNMHPTSWWQDEQLHTPPHKTPYDGGVHFWEQFTPVYPAGHPTNYNASLLILRIIWIRA